MSAPVQEKVQRRPRAGFGPADTSLLTACSPRKRGGNRSSSGNPEIPFLRGDGPMRADRLAARRAQANRPLRVPTHLRGVHGRFDRGDQGDNSAQLITRALGVPRLSAPSVAKDKALDVREREDNRDQHERHQERAKSDRGEGRACAPHREHEMQNPVCGSQHGDDRNGQRSVLDRSPPPSPRATAKHRADQLDGNRQQSTNHEEEAAEPSAGYADSHQCPFSYVSRGRLRTSSSSTARTKIKALSSLSG